MGLIRKTLSVSTAGLVDFRSDKERTAAYTRRRRKEAIRQTRLIRQQVSIEGRQASQTQSRYVDRNRGDSAALMEELERLSDLHRRGDLTDLEFSSAKAEILGLG